MSRGDVALGDAEQAGKPGFRCKEIVTARVETIAAEGVAERQKLAFRVEQKGEIHRHGHLAGRLG